MDREYVLQPKGLKNRWVLWKTRTGKCKTTGNRGNPPYFIAFKKAVIPKAQFFLLGRNKKPLSNNLNKKGEKYPLTTYLWGNPLTIVLHEVWMHKLKTFHLLFLWNFFYLFLAFWQFLLLRLNYLMCNGQSLYTYFKRRRDPWLVGLSGLSTSLQTERFPVPFPVRAHAWVSGQVPSWGCVGGSRLMCLSNMDVSLPLFPPSFPCLKVKK